MMKRHTKEDIDLIQTAQAHLRLLRNEANYNADEAILRAASGPLRALLVEGLLIRAWKLIGIGGPITLRAQCIVSSEGSDVVAYCGGADMLPNISFAVGRNARTAEKSLNLQDYLNSTRIRVGETEVSTKVLIQYVANTRGGAHYESGSKRKPEYELLADLESGKIPGPAIRINNRNPLHHEILSIAQAILRSPEVSYLSAWQPAA
jgi:hypothetical protein